MTVVLALLLAAGTDWSVFPEGKSSYRDTNNNALTGNNRTSTWIVSRQGTRVAVELRVASTGGTGNRDPRATSVHFVTESLTAPAKSTDGDTFALSCAKKKLTIHSEDLRFVYPSEPECDGRTLKARSRSPKHVGVLECQVAGSDTKLLFVPGRSVEHLFENNDCTMHEGIRFVPE